MCDGWECHVWVAGVFSWLYSDAVVNGFDSRDRYRTKQGGQDDFGQNDYLGNVVRSENYPVLELFCRFKSGAIFVAAELLAGHVAR